jgi:hypothetical protein
LDSGDDGSDPRTGGVSSPGPVRFYWPMADGDAKGEFVSIFAEGIFIRRLGPNRSRFGQILAWGDSFETNSVHNHRID